METGLLSLHSVNGTSERENDSTADCVSIALVIQFSPLLIAGILIYKKIDKQEIIEELSI